MSGRMSGCVKCGKPTTALINHIMHASKKELRQMLISFITSEPISFEYEPIEEVKAQRPDVDNAHVIAAEMSRKLTKEELIATPMTDLSIVSEIREKYPKRLTDKKMHSQQQYIEITKQAYMRLFIIEDIIYGEEEENERNKI